MPITARVIRKDFIKLPDKIKGPRQVKVGFPAGKASSTNIDKAIWNEFGTRGGRSGGGWGGPIPERPFMRNSARNNANKYRQMMAGAVTKIVIGKMNLREVMTDLGLVAVADIQREIRSLMSPPNSPVTIARKGANNPLIDTGQMRMAVTFKIENK